MNLSTLELGAVAAAGLFSLARSLGNALSSLFYSFLTNSARTVPAPSKSGAGVHSFTIRLRFTVMQVNNA